MIAEHLGVDIPLPDDGVIRAVCDNCAHPTTPACTYGIYFIPAAETMIAWATRFDFINSQHTVLTYGTASGRILRGIHSYVGGIPQPAASLRADSFRVTAILTAGSGLSRYSAPVYRGALAVQQLWD